ncbi:MAG: transporter substrate-binding domain-containing protein [Oscillospiraceae bacterium]|nr:transporter substrate-binding domain-containing protein [Oscillospiraceae bacterium]
MKKNILMVALLFGIIASLAACAGQSEEEDDDWSAIVARGTLRIGVAESAPLVYTGDDGALTGFDVALATAVCDKLGLAPTFVTVGADSAEMLTQGQVDCVWSGVPTEDTTWAQATCSSSFRKSTQVLVMRADLPEADGGTWYLPGKNVCAQAGSDGEYALSANPDLMQARYLAKETQDACLLAVVSGEADGAVVDIKTAQMMKFSGMDFSSLAVYGDSIAQRDYCVACRKDSALAAQLDSAMAQLISENILQQIGKTYGVEVVVE